MKADWKEIDDDTPLDRCLLLWDGEQCIRGRFTNFDLQDGWFFTGSLGIALIETVYPECCIPAECHPTHWDYLPDGPDA